MLSFPEPVELTSEQQQTLRAQTINENAPGPIVRDFETLLAFIAERDLAASGVFQLPPLQVAPQLNALLARPLDVGLKRPQWKSFPPLFGLYLLLRASALVRVEPDGKKQKLRLDEAALENWRALNATEKYFTLLETWLLRSDDEIIGERVGWMTPLRNAMQFWQSQKFPERSDSHPNYSDPIEEFRFWPGLHHLALCEEFGLIEIEHAAADDGKGWNFKSVRFTPFGDALLTLIVSQAPEFAIFRSPKETNEAWIDHFIAAENAPNWGAWQEIFAPYFADWRENFVLPEIEKIEGICVFKVSLGKVWRRIAISSEDLLVDLSDAILSAFGFDNDHLHQFSYRDRFGAQASVHHPFMEGSPPFTSEMTVGEVPLRAGDSMIYLFDFGDQWEFEVKLEEVQPPNAKIKRARVLEKHGKAPEQYPDYGDWD